MNAKRILITGDSFVEGVGTVHGGWAQKFAVKPGCDAEIVIKGIGGQNTADLLARLEDELALQPEIVVVGIGTNDSRWRPSLDRHEIPLAEFRRNLEILIARILERNAMPVLLGLTRVDEALTIPFKEDKIYRNQYLAAYSDNIRYVARALGGTFIAMPELANTPGMLSDGLHPSEPGHRVLLEAVLAGLSHLRTA